jgi:hypothetical protein
MKKFTTKTTQPTGRYRSFDSAMHEIKLNGICVGTISDKKPYHIKLRVTKEEADKINDKDPNCEWKRITLKKEFESVNEAKEWVKENSERIQTQFKIHAKE